MVRDPMEYNWGNTKSVDNRGGIDGIWYPVEVKTGDFLLFPPWLYHKTEKNLSNESRYVMSINYDIARR
jgi:ectoine hydroxylase-related dioxygenase (phytanoyl-CoA dioxygenase family)